MVTIESETKVMSYHTAFYHFQMKSHRLIIAPYYSPIVPILLFIFKKN